MRVLMVNLEDLKNRLLSFGIFEIWVNNKTYRTIEFTVPDCRRVRWKTRLVTTRWTKDVHIALSWTEVGTKKWGREYETPKRLWDCSHPTTFLDGPDRVLPFPCSGHITVSWDTSLLGVRTKSRDDRDRTLILMKNLLLDIKIKRDPERLVQRPGCT